MLELILASIAPHPSPYQPVFIGRLLLNGAGATKTTLSIDVTSILLVHLPSALLLAFYFDLGPIGVWLSFPLTEAVRAILGVIAYKSGRWAVVGLDTTGGDESTSAA